MSETLSITQESLKYHTAFQDALESLDNVIVDASVKSPKLFVNRLKRGAYKNGTGLVQTTSKFFSGLTDQAGLTDWRTIAASTAPGQNTPGRDACNDYPAKVVDAGFERATYTGVETFRRTKDICVNDIKWNWEFEQQLALYMGWLPEVSMNVWDNFGREGVMNIAKKYCMTAGDFQSATFTYDPFASTGGVAVGNPTITKLSWAFLRSWHTFLSLSRPQSATGNLSGQPLWTFVIDPQDYFDQLIEGDSKVQEASLYAQPDVLLENYGTVKTFRGFQNAYNMIMPRFSNSSGTLTRVEPYKEEATTYGVKQVFNQNYMTADYGVALILPNDPLQILVPQVGPASVAGMNFGVQPGLNGDFRWLNYVNDNNPLGEKGRYFARFQAFLKPGVDSNEVIAILYKRS